MRPGFLATQLRRRRIMQNGAHIGPSLVIKGEISAREPLSISGRVEGSIEVTGHIVTVQSGAHVGADITAAGIVVAGAVKGSLNAESRSQPPGRAEGEGEYRGQR